MVSTTCLLLLKVVQTFPMSIGGVLILGNDPSLSLYMETNFGEILSFSSRDPWILGVISMLLDGLAKNYLLFAHRSMKLFNLFIENVGLRDIPLQNGRFTWSCNREASTLSHIDRFLVFDEVRAERFS